MNNKGGKTKGPDTTEVMTRTDPLTDSLRESRLRRACLMVVFGQDIGRRYWITKDVTIAGRDPEADFYIDIKKMSRKHFALLHKKPKYYLKDLGSRNGTIVNDKKILGEVELKYGDKIQCGGTVLQFVSEASIEHMLVDKLRQDIYRDGLTQIYNKKILPEIEKEMFQRSQADQTPLSILMFDIDHFKKVNDTYGHLFGDQVLAGLALEIQTKVVRAEDILVRFGGEEFLVAMPHADSKVVLAVGERIRKSAAKLEFEHKGQKIKITVSVGVRFWDPPVEPQIGSLQGLIYDADQALYVSKQQGRNRVTSFRSSEKGS